MDYGFYSVVVFTVTVTIVVVILLNRTGMNLSCRFSASGHKQIASSPRSNMDIPCCRVPLLISATTISGSTKVRHGEWPPPVPRGQGTRPGIILPGIAVQYLSVYCFLSMMPYSRRFSNPLFSLFLCLLVV